jgi:starch synthase
LADVIGALPRALARLGHEVDVLMPRYRGIDAGEPLKGALAVPVAGSAYAARLSAVRADGVRTIFVAHPAYFDRDSLYGPGGTDYPDNAERFAFLARAAVEWASRNGRYDIIHGHDWQAGLVPVLLATDPGKGEPLRGVGTVFTIHNLAYQGIFDAGWLVRLGLSPTLLRVDGLEYWGRLSFLKGGILFSRLLTTVSPQYAREIQGPDLGFGFEGILAGRSGDLVGILNGIDYDQWDPSRDPHLPEPFDASNLKGKTAAKRALLARYGFPVKRETLERPLVGMVSRMVDQKGFDLLSTVAAQLPQAGATFVVLGSGERRYEEQWREMATRHPDAIGVYIGFEEDLAHLIEGGSDLFLMPSRFEPCGLNQMYSLRYGTVPVVRATGGLRDTVQPVDPASGEGTGFVFEEYSADALWRALQAAIGLYRDKTRWRRIQRAGMRQDFSWERSARAYEAVYERARVTN